MFNEFIISLAKKAKQVITSFVTCRNVKNLLKQHKQQLVKLVMGLGDLEFHFKLKQASICVLF